MNLGRCSRALAIALGIACMPGEASAVTHEFALRSAASLYGGSTRLIAGIGGGAAYRLHSESGIVLYAEASWLLYLGNSFSAAIGLMYEFHFGAWQPALGLQAAGFIGDQVRVVTSSTPDAPPPYAFAGQIRVAPLRFASGNFTAAVLVVDYGYGWEAGTLTPALTVGLLDVGVRF